MNYKETLDYLFAQLPMFQRIGKAAYKANLDNSIALDEYFNHPHHKFRCVHIAGTNGKGSVSHTLASILHQAGYKTGLYTSPHLKDFRERIKINGQKIPEQYVLEFVEKHREAFEPINPSFFELTVAMAFDYFANERVDAAIIETGLGGRLDSTNIIKPDLSVITNISYDHSQFLGDTLEKIATEKAGIIKAGVPVLIGESQKKTDAVFIEKSNQLRSPVFFASQHYQIKDEPENDYSGQVFQVYQRNELIFPNLKMDLKGIYQRKNAITILMAVELLQQAGYQISKEHIYAGFAQAAQSTGLLGRWQTLSLNPLTICDIGHNEGGISIILEQIKTIKYNRLHIVFGMVDDKDIDRILEMLPINATYYFCRASIPRALDEKILQKKAGLFGIEGQTYTSVENALHAARENADKDDFIFIGGSTFVVAEVC